MKLYLDNIIFYLQKFGGISVYWNQLISYLIQQKEIDTKFIELLQAPCKFKERVSIPSDQIIYDKNLILKALRYLPISKQKVSGNAILHSSYFRFSRSNSVKNIITIYDFTYEHRIKGITAIIHHFQKSQAIKHAAGIICISENTKKDLLKFYPYIDEKKVKVTYLSSSDLFYKNESLSIDNTKFNYLKDKKILSFAGKRIKYKKFNIAIDIIKKLPDDYHLLIIGGGILTDAEKKSLSSVSEKYTYIQHVNSVELNDIYNISFCYLYPSEYEGFGIPVLESMQAGCPVLCQNISSIPEVYGNVENIVTKINDINQCCENIRRLEDPNYRRKIIEQGRENSKRFSWTKTFNETIEFYRSIQNC